MQTNFGDYEGEFCEGTDLDLPEANRNLRIEFVCNSDITDFTESLSNIVITELEKENQEACNAAFRIETSYGCPAECGIDSNGVVCSGQGECGYDSRDGTAKCFCYAGTHIFCFP